MKSSIRDDDEVSLLFVLLDWCQQFVKKPLCELPVLFLCPKLFSIEVRVSLDQGF